MRTFLKVMCCLAVTNAIAVSAAPVDEAMAEKGHPEQLRALRGVDLPPDIAKKISGAIKQLKPKEAKVRAADILRADLSKRGVLNPSPGKSITTNLAQLRAAFPDALVFATANTAYTNLKFEPAQVIPGTAIPRQASVVGPVGSQTVPGTEKGQLADCDKPFEQITKNCGPIKNGMRCETFSRKQFAEVAKIVLPDGDGVCSGTLIADRWVLTAAHCFLPKMSAGSFVGTFPENKTASGDAVIKGAALYQSQVHFPYSDLPLKQRRIEMVIVNAAWDPAGNIAEGRTVTINNQKVAVNYVYPGDLALIELKDAIPSQEVLPAAIASKDYSGVITTVGYGYTTVGDGNFGELWVTWPDPPVVSASGQLELELKQGPAVSTFCRGDSGGPAYEGRLRGCAPPGEKRPRTLIGVTSYFYGAQSAGNPQQQAAACMSAPVMRFVNVSAETNRKWLCKTLKGGQIGC